MGMFVETFLDTLQIRAQETKEIHKDERKLKRPMTEIAIIQTLKPRPLAGIDKQSHPCKGTNQRTDERRSESTGLHKKGFVQVW